MAEKMLKKAVITTGGKQYLVAEGQELEVELLASDKKPVFEPIMVIAGESVSVGNPSVAGAQVKADVLEAEIKQDKVTAIRYKSKKRVNKRRGHRQKLTRIKVTAISVK
jgi:large subunit ribosomal protein L21